MVAKLVLAGVMAATAVVGGVMAAQAHRRQGQQQQKVHEYNADINERNAVVAKTEAEQIKRVTNWETNQWEIESNNLKDQQSMAFSKMGWMADSGTPALVMADLANDIGREKNTRLYNAAVASDRKIEGGVQQGIQANLNRAYGQQARYAGQARAGASLLGTAQRVGTTFMMA